LAAVTQGRALGFSLPVNLLLVLAPMAFGIRGANLIIIAGVFPIALLGDDLASATRIATILLAIGIARRFASWVPSYVISVASWACFILPAREVFVPTASVVALHAGYPAAVLFTCLSDVLITLVAGALLLNATLWCFLTHSPRHWRLDDLVIHVLTLTSILSVFSVLAILNRIGMFGHSQLAASNLWAAFGLIAMFALVPTLIGFRLSTITSRDFGSLLAPQLVPQSMVTTKDTEVSGALWVDVKARKSSPMASRDPQKELSDATSDGRDEGGTLAPTGVCAVDGDGSVLFMNDAFRAFADIALPGTVGRILSSLSSDSPLVNEISELLITTEPTAEVVRELKLVDKNGHSRFFEISLRHHDVGNAADGGSSTANDSGEIRTPRVINLRDVTDKRTVGRHLLESQRLVSLAQAVSRAGLSLADTFTSIAGHASHAMYTGKPNEACQKALSSIFESALTNGRLAGQLLELSKGHSSSTWSVADLREILHERLSLLQNLAGDGFSLSLQTRADPLFVKADLALLIQALTQLVLNAREAYYQNNGPIELILDTEELDQTVAYVNPGARPGKFARLRIVDSGSGMVAEILTRAVDPLFSTRREAGHSGLGLSIVFAIMREHDGFLTLESKPERGTTVSLYLPLLDSVPPEHVGHTTSQTKVDSVLPPTSLSSAGENQQVLVLEGREELRSILTQMVSSLGYRAASCKDGDEALRLARNQKVDIVLLDDSLPEFKADDCLKRLRAEHAAIKAVTLNTCVGTTTQNVNARVLKPFGISELSHALKTALNG